MRSSTLASLLALAGAVAAAQDPTTFFRFRRSVPAPPAGQVCATVDAAMYAHSALSLKDVRLFGRSSAGLYEIPYVLTLSEAQPVVGDTARILNLGHRGDRIVFDLQMPGRTFSDIDLDLDGTDFIATAEVSSRSAGAKQPIRLGDFTLFDLTSQHLGRTTTLHLAESNFRSLHVELRVRGVNGIAPRSLVIKGATVPASREAQTLYTVAARTDEFQQRGRETVAHFALPARVPIEQVRIVLQTGFSGNFSREVMVRARAHGDSAAEVEQVRGRVERVRMERGGVEIESQQLSIPATLGANLQTDADVDVTIQNGDDPPLPLNAIELATRKRSLCFESRGSAPELFYGDNARDAPTYDYTRTFSVSASMTSVLLGEEQRNPAWRARPDDRVFTERHPHLVYFALLGAVCILALVAFRSGKLHNRR